MPAVVSRPPQAERKRRVHAKSRRGCGNCKLRRVKCDELRPQCKKCILFGVDCNYGSTTRTLQLPTQGSFQVDLMATASTDHVIEFSAAAPGTWESQEFISTAQELEKHSSWSHGAVASASQFWPQSSAPYNLVSMSSTVATMIDDSLQLEFSASDMQPTPGSEFITPVSFWHFTEAHLEILGRFRDRTALTIGNKSTAPAYRDILCQLAMTHPFLMHMLLSLTLMHDADFAAGSSRSTANQKKRGALQHWNTATKLFQNLLAKPVHPNQRDAIWATAVVIGAASFWFVNSDKVEEVWPLKPSEPDDLGWLRLGDGKRALWRLSDPTRPDSMFYNILRFRKAYRLSEPEWVREGNAADCIPLRIKEIFNVTCTSTIENNAYLMPLLLLSRIQDMRLTHDTAISFLLVIAFITPQFIALMEAKDPRAVFIVGWWFKLMSDGDMWWMISRARIEGRAIRIWLGRTDTEHGLAGLLDSMVRQPGSINAERIGLSTYLCAGGWDREPAKYGGGKDCWLDRG
ncbi:hypothetical protein DE146DRAFT_645004 [Phaeosphaeria sp. MPI-PUGE-AT-0046c]|nr:hypothetical protein DE146DRAFT_645004 [Phaeosphaeria sp. MPI-PUGE-AT-0046c]